MIVGFQEEASMKYGSRNFCENFKNTSEQMPKLFSKI